jgi:hypothetical protein
MPFLAEHNHRHFENLIATCNYNLELLNLCNALFAIIIIITAEISRAEFFKFLQISEVESISCIQELEALAVHKATRK